MAFLEGGGGGKVNLYERRIKMKMKEVCDAMVRKSSKCYIIIKCVIVASS